MSYVPLFPLRRSLSNPKMEKRFSCPIDGCNKTYVRKAFVTEHLRSHTNTRPFACDQCDKKFLRDSHLKSHRWVHSDEKPLGCDHCDRRFITNQQLRRHLKTHEPKQNPQEEKHEPSKDIYLWKVAAGEKHRVTVSPSSSGTYASPKSIQSHDTSLRTSISATDPVPELHMCPYDCPNVYQDGRSLSDHILEDHILTDTINVDEHMEHLHKTMCEYPSEQFMEKILNWDGKDWSEVHCMEVDCQGPSLSYTDHESLIAHYDDYHGFVPDSLFEYAATELCD